MAPGDLVKIDMPGSYEHGRRAVVISQGPAGDYHSGKRAEWLQGMWFVQLQCDWLSDKSLVVLQEQVRVIRG